MFQWFHEYSLDVDFPIQKVWEFCLEPKNWPKWTEKFESCHCEGELKTGSTIRVKIKTRFPQDIYMPIFIKEIQPYECKMLLKVPFFAQENVCTLQEISLQKTRISVNTCVKSFFVPLMRSHFYKKIEKAKTKEFKRFLEVLEKELK